MSSTSFGVTVTLTYFLELLCQGHISYIIWGRNPIFCMDSSLDGDMLRTIQVTVTLTYDIVSRIIVSGAYCLYYFR